MTSQSWVSSYPTPMIWTPWWLFPSPCQWEWWKAHHTSIRSLRLPATCSMRRCSTVGNNNHRTASNRSRRLCPVMLNLHPQFMKGHPRRAQWTCSLPHHWHTWTSTSTILFWWCKPVAIGRHSLKHSTALHSIDQRLWPLPLLNSGGPPHSH